MKEKAPNIEGREPQFPFFKIFKFFAWMMLGSKDGSPGPSIFLGKKIRPTLIYSLLLVSIFFQVSYLIIHFFHKYII